MGRKRLLALITGLTMLVPLPAAALEAGVPVADAADAVSESSPSGDDTTVPLPGVGAISAGGDLDPEGAGSLRVSAEATAPVAPVSVRTTVAVSGSASDGLDVEAAAPVTVGDTTIDPIAEVVAPVVDAVRAVTEQVAPGVVPDVRPAQPGATTPATQDGGSDVRAAAVPNGPGGVQERVVDVPARSVVVRRDVAAPAARDAGPTTDVFDVASEPAAEVASRDSVDVAAPAVPDPVTVPALLRVLAALLVVAAGFTNRVVARELR